MSNADAVMTEYNFIPLIMKFVAPAVGSVSEASEQAQRLMNASFTLRAFDPVADEWFEWSPGLEIIAGWLEVERLDQRRWVFGGGHDVEVPVGEGVGVGVVA